MTENGKSVKLEQIIDSRGVLLPLEDKMLPFKINRLLYLKKGGDKVMQLPGTIESFALLTVHSGGKTSKNDFSFTILTKQELRSRAYPDDFSGLLFWEGNDSSTEDYHNIPDTQFLSGDIVPVEIPRLFFIKDVPYGVSRGGHAQANGEQYLIMLNGFCKLNVRDKSTEKSYLLNSNSPFYLPRMKWVTLTDFSPGALLLVLCNQSFEGCEYIRNLSDYLEEK